VKPRSCRNEPIPSQRKTRSKSKTREKPSKLKFQITASNFNKKFTNLKRFNYLLLKKSGACCSSFGIRRIVGFDLPDIFEIEIKGLEMELNVAKIFLETCFNIKISFTSIPEESQSETLTKISKYKLEIVRINLT
jgi:hypothetical protein